VGGQAVSPDSESSIASGAARGLYDLAARFVDQRGGVMRGDPDDAQENAQ
jgi:hypothetical protein